MNTDFHNNNIFTITLNWLVLSCQLSFINVTLSSVMFKFGDDGQLKIKILIGNTQVKFSRKKHHFISNDWYED